MSQPAGELIRIMGIDETAGSAEHDDTLVSPALRPDVVDGIEQRLQRQAIRAALFGGGEAASIGRFRLLDRLGEGAMGRVYAAYDEQLDRKIAIKLIRSSALDSTAVERTLREARALARVSHPNVVHVYEVGQVDGQLFVAMEFLAGPTLRAWLDERRDRSWQQLLAVLRQAGEGLAAAHAEGVIHRDFKPQNLMFGADGRIRVLDFGLARVGDGELRSNTPKLSEPAISTITTTGALMGTPAYMAPEQLEGRPADIRSDVFSFCVTLFEALHGKRPFRGQTLAELRDAAAQGRIEQPSGAAVPRWLHEVVLRGLSADPAQRFASMPELLAALARDPAVLRRRWWAAAAVVGLLGGGGWGLSQVIDRNEQPDEQLQLAAERTAVRSSELLAQGNTADALAQAIEAAAIYDSKKTREALFEATAADLSWGAIAEFPGFPETVDFSPDGTRLAIARKQETHFGVAVHTIEIHDLEHGGSMLVAPTHGCPVPELDLGAARLIARCHESEDLHVWDASTGAPVASFDGELSPEFSSAGLRVATREQRVVTLTDVSATPNIVATLEHPEPPTLLEFSADGSLLATGGANQDTRIWDTRSGTLTVLAGSQALAIAFFTDGSDRVATVGVDRQVRIWAIRSGELLATLATPLDSAAELTIEKLHDLAISPDGRRVALYLDRKARLWDSSGELVGEIVDQSENPLGTKTSPNRWVGRGNRRPLRFSHDGSRLAIPRHDGSILLLDANSGTTLARSNVAWSYSFSPDGQSLAIGAGEFMEIWDSSSGARVMSVPSRLPVLVGFSPDGSLLAAPDSHSDEAWVSEWHTRLTRIEPQPKATLEIVGRSDKRAGVAFTADGSRLITADDLVARVWDTRSGAELAVLHGHLGPITSMSTPTSPGTPYLATAGLDGTLFVWNLDSNQRHGQLSGHAGAVRLVRFSHDGTVLGSIGDDQTVRLWDPASLQPLGDPLAHPGPVTALKISHDATRLLTASGELAYLWDVRSRAKIVQLAGHEDDVQSVAISDDGSRIATHDGERIRLWDSSGGLIHELTDPGKFPTVEFSPDGERLSSASGLWNVDSGRLVTELENHDEMDRPLTEPDRDPVTFSADGGLLAWHGRVWNAHTGVLIGEFFTGHEQRLYATGLLPSGARLVTVSPDAVVIRDAKHPLAAACDRLRPFAASYASVADVCDRHRSNP